jgi:2-amino-4-hydroxy-6-hydroxymethyldihydropteridine diphosphokinase
LVEGSSFHLVEKMAAEIAALCLDEPAVERVTVRVEKPGALRFARSVGVEIERTRAELGRVNRAFLLLGSNINPQRYLHEAVQRLAARCRVLAVSPVYESLPVGTTNQPNFLNAEVLIETRHTAGELKAEVLQPIEQERGRVRTEDKNAPRTIDLDIALFNDEVLDLGHRHIPDPDLLRFSHIARPLADLAPRYCHPETEQTLAEIAERLPSAGLTPRFDVDLQPNSAPKST